MHVLCFIVLFKNMITVGIKDYTYNTWSVLTICWPILWSKLMGKRSDLEFNLVVYSNLRDSAHSCRAIHNGRCHVISLCRQAALLVRISCLYLKE